MGLGHISSFLLGHSNFMSEAARLAWPWSVHLMLAIRLAVSLRTGVDCQEVTRLNLRYMPYISAGVSGPGVYLAFEYDNI